ncbi:MAG TPA: hypothetical protein VKR61_20115 [Bryobacteraceae bacterium]|nr:hypothetical protein [Bryobacteraceae bacterium]
MKDKITRRQLAGAVLATAAAAQTPSQTPPATPSGPAPELQAARDQNQRASETLAKVEVPMDTEPAFHFSV